MNDKKAFVFDTNFIIEHPKDLREVVDNLSDGFNVYVTQVSVDERISQQYLETKKLYDDIPNITAKYHNIANIKITTEITKRHQFLKDSIQNKYNKLFGGRVIPFISSKEMLDIILDRVYKKIPPFSSADGASDRGFKDTLMWYSVMEYFNNNGEDEVVFITNDKGFTKSVDVLQNEFNEFTGKKIEFRENTYYKDLIKKEVQPTSEQVLPPLPDVSELRDKIQNVISAMCRSVEYDNWDNAEWFYKFTLNVKVNALEIESMFLDLRKIIENNIFETEIQADNVLQLGDNIINNRSISMNVLQESLKLYEEIRDKMRDYLPQFFNTAANIINRNYKEPPATSFTDDIPF
jgi:hypothetical protein